MYISEENFHNAILIGSLAFMVIFIYAAHFFGWFN